VVYVYAVVRGTPRTRGLRGLLGEPLRVVAGQHMLAIVGDVPARPEPTLGNVRGHDRVVTAIAARFTAVLPARLAAVVDDDAAVANALQERGATLDAALKLVAGREQMTLRLSGSAMPAPDAVPTHSHDLGPGARYLTGRLAARRAEVVVPELAAWRPLLAPLVRAERVERHVTPPLVATVYHLIDRGAAPAYEHAVSAGDTAVADVYARVSGPWAPYAFAPDEVP
jgi:hypothetical protein